MLVIMVGLLRLLLLLPLFMMLLPDVAALPLLPLFIKALMLLLVVTLLVVLVPVLLAELASKVLEPWCMMTLWPVPLLPILTLLEELPASRPPLTGLV